MTGLFDALVDDAGMFPPAALPPPAALARHRRDLAAAHPVHSGRLICAADRLPEVLTLIRPDESIRLSVVGAIEGLDGHPGVRLEAVEHLPGQKTSFPGRRFVEISDPDQVTGVPAAKIRCGGLRGDLFPTPEHLATLLSACVRAGIPFKATAGLHEAVRHRDPRTGFVHHGFLNLIVAVARILDGEAPPEIVSVLTSEDEKGLAAAARDLTPQRAGEVRRAFVSYGSCDTAEPVRELVRLGLIAEAA